VKERKAAVGAIKNDLEIQDGDKVGNLCGRKFAHLNYHQNKWILRLTASLFKCVH
jgi:hypothetical protein